jgi:hypothetical protein
MLRLLGELRGVVQSGGLRRRTPDASPSGAGHSVRSWLGRLDRIVMGHHSSPPAGDACACSIARSSAGARVFAWSLAFVRQSSLREGAP